MKNLFENWLDGCSMTRVRVAELLGVDPSYVTHLAAGRVKPGLGLAARIEALSNGTVRAVSWVHDQKPAATPKRAAGASRGRRAPARPSTRRKAAA